MKIVITGAVVLVGSALIRNLSSQGSKIFKNIHIVYHLAGIISITSGEKKLIESINVTGTQNVIDACLKSNLGRLVYMSSVHALTELPQGQLIDEATQISPNKIIGDYAKSKAKATLAVLDRISCGLEAVIVYPP